MINIKNNCRQRKDGILFYECGRGVSYEFKKEVWKQDNFILPDGFSVDEAAENVLFLNKGEILFQYWLSEAKRFNIIKEYHWHKYRFDLSPAAKLNGKRISPATFTPDVVFIAWPEWRYFLELAGFIPAQLDGETVYVNDIKAGYDPRQESVRQVFEIKRKVMYYLHNVYCNEVHCSDYRIASKRFQGLFAKTWVPKKCYYNKNKTVSKKYINCSLVEEYVQRCMDA